MEAIAPRVEATPTSSKDMPELWVRARVLGDPSEAGGLGGFGRCFWTHKKRTRWVRGLRNLQPVFGPLFFSKSIGGTVVGLCELKHHHPLLLVIG